MTLRAVGPWNVHVREYFRDYPACIEVEFHLGGPWFSFTDATGVRHWTNCGVIVTATASNPIAAAAPASEEHR